MIANRRDGSAPQRRLMDEARRRIAGLAVSFTDPAEVLATARILVAAGELQVAHRAYRHAKKIGVDDPSAEVEHGEVLRRLGRSSEAVAELEAAATRYRTRGEFRSLAVVECGLGEHYRDTGAIDRALRIAERWLTHPEVWDLATFLWVDCVSLEGRSLEGAVKRAVERGNASPAMFHALLQDLEGQGDLTLAGALLAIGDETLFPGWLDAIPEMRRLADRLLAGTAEAVRVAT